MRHDTPIYTEEEVSNRIVAAIGLIVALVVALFIIKLVFGILAWGLPVLVGAIIGYIVGRASSASRALEKGKTTRLERVA